MAEQLVSSFRLASNNCSDYLVHKTRKEEKRRHKVKMKPKSTENNIYHSITLLIVVDILLISSYLSSARAVVAVAASARDANSPVLGKPLPSTRNLSPLPANRPVRNDFDGQTNMLELPIGQSATSEANKPRLIRRKWTVVASRWQNEVLLPCQIVGLDEEQTVSFKPEVPFKSQTNFHLPMYIHNELVWLLHDPSGLPGERVPDNAGCLLKPSAQMLYCSPVIVQIALLLFLLAD